MQSVTGLTQRRDTVYQYARADPEGGIRNWVRRRCLDVCIEHRACDDVKKKQHSALHHLVPRVYKAKRMRFVIYSTSMLGGIFWMDHRNGCQMTAWQKNTLALFIIRSHLVEESPIANESAPQLTIEFGLRSTPSGASDSDPRTRSAMIVHPGLVLFSW